MPADSPQLEGLDVTGIESVGSVYGEVNFEAIAELEPDLIVTLYDPEQTGPVFGFLDDGEELAEAIAPVLVIDGGSKADAEPTIERFIDLGEAMGGDLDDAAIDASRQRFDDAVAALRSTVEGNPASRWWPWRPMSVTSSTSPVRRTSPACGCSRRRRRARRAGG